jgi:hypothetical protein
MRTYFSILILVFSITTLSAQTTSWRGNTNNSWFNPSNWTNGVPDSSTDAILGDNNFTGSFQPEIKSSATCQSLIVGNGGRAITLTVNSDLTVVENIMIGSHGTIDHSNKLIALGGNWMNKGSYVVSGNNSQIEFNGTTELLDGVTDFRNLTVDFGSTLIATADISISRTFNVNGTFNPASFKVSHTGKTFSIGASGVLIVNQSTFEENYPQSPTSINSKSTIEYASSSVNQTIANLNYGNLALSGTATKTFKSGITNVNSFINNENSIATLPNSATLKIDGDFTNNGVFTATNHTIQFSGSGTQNIGGTSVTSFYNIVVANNSNQGVSIESNQQLRGVLTLGSNNKFDADGSNNTAVFTLISTNDNITQDAAIATLPSGAQVTGNVTVQRFMSKEGANNNRIYRYISSPVAAATVADIQNEIPVTGNFIGTSICSGCSKSASLFSYTENIISDTDGNGVNDKNDGYISFPTSSNSETLTLGKGYALFVRANLLSSTMWDVRGTINQANTSAITFPVTYKSSGRIAEDGWNLVGNPFPSTIDWNASGWTKSNMSGTIYIPDNGSITTKYATWNGVTGTNGGSRYIAMGQGFWVKASGNGIPTLRATESVKTAGTQTTFFREGAPENLLRVTLGNNISSDETVIHFREDATSEFDEQADAVKLANEGVNLSTLLQDGTPLAINSLGSLNCNEVVSLDLGKLSAGSFTLDFSEFESFSEPVSIILFDKKLNIEQEIIKNSRYSFSISSNEIATSRNRFEVRFAKISPSLNFLLSQPRVCQNSETVVEIQNSRKDVTYQVMAGSTIPVSEAIGNESTLQLTIPANKLESGINSLLLRATINGCTVNTEATISVERVDVTTATIGDVPARCGEGSFNLTASGAPANGWYNWYTSIDEIEPVKGHQANWTTPVISKSKTFYVAAVNSLGCEGERVAVRATVNHLDPVAISDVNGILKSSYETENQWYFNNEIISGATSSSYQPDKSGIYTVEVSMNGCTTQASEEYVITGVEKEITGISAYPNPVINDLTVVLPIEEQTMYTVQLYSILGQLIKTSTHAGSSESIIVNMSDLQTGTYILKVLTSQGKRQTLSILKK